MQDYFDINEIVPFSFTEPQIQTFEGLSSLLEKKGFFFKFNINETADGDHIQIIKKKDPRKLIEICDQGDLWIETSTKTEMIYGKEMDINFVNHLYILFR